MKSKYRVTREIKEGEIVSYIVTPEGLKSDWFEKVEEEHPVFKSLSKGEWISKELIAEFGYRAGNSPYKVHSRTEAFHIASEYARAINGANLDFDKYYYIDGDLDIVWRDLFDWAGEPRFTEIEYAEQAIKDIPEVFKILLHVE